MAGHGFVLSAAGLSIDEAVMKSCLSRTKDPKEFPKEFPKETPKGTAKLRLLHTGLPRDKIFECCERDDR